MPPTISAGNLKRRPKVIPIKLPKRDIKNDVNPMMSIGWAIALHESMPMHVNDTPTARASMLVAMARVRSTDILDVSKARCSSGLIPSIIILAPMNDRSPNAIQ